MIKIIEKKVADLVPYENNARINDGAVEAVANSIREFGIKNPIIIDRDNVIVCGHTRIKACEKLGIETVPCVVADDLTDEQIKAFRIADNSTAQIAEWDLEKLQAELEDIDMDMVQFGLQEQIEDIEKEFEKEVQEDEVPEVDEENEPICKLGDIWQLGRHRLICGDSTDKATVERLMDGNKADLLLTDPPYNVALGMGGSVDEARKRHRRTDGLVIMNDKMEDSAFFEFLLKCFTAGRDALKEGGAFYIWHADNEGLNFRSALKSSGLTLRQTLIWNKNAITLGRQDYQWKHEPCLYGWKDGAAHYFIDDRTQATVFEDTKPDFKKMKKEELLKLLEEIYSDKISTTVIHEDKPTKSAEHPTMKPIKLLARQIKNSSKQTESVLDLFGGSGSTLIACEQLNRKCYMMELDPKYCDVIIKRWENLTGQKAVKIC